MFGDVDGFKWGMNQVREGKIKPLLDRTFSLSDASVAHRLISNNKVEGNLVLLPWAD